MRFAESKNYILVMMIIILFATLTLFLMLSSHPYLETEKAIITSDIVELTSGWQYLHPGTGKWESLIYPGPPPVSSKDSLSILRIALPDSTARSTYLFINSGTQSLEVSCEGTVIYRFGSLKEKPRSYSYSYAWRAIPLDKTYAGKPILLKMRSTGNSVSGRLSRAYLGSRTDFIIMQLRTELSAIITAFILIFISIYLLIIFLAKRRNMIVAIPLCLFAICTGIWTISNTSISKSFLIDNPGFWYYARLGTQFLIPTFFVMAVRLMFSDRKSVILRYLWQISLGYAIAAMLSEYLDIAPMVVFTKPFLFLVLLIVIIVGIFIVSSVMSGNVNMRLFLLGFLMLILAGIHDVLVVYGRVISSSVMASTWGMLIFLLFILFILEKNFYEAEKRLEYYSNEIQQKDKSLEENQRLLDQTLENDKIKNEFLSNISHEFRTPLNIMLSNLQLMNLYIRNGEIRSEKRDLGKYMGIMKQNCYRLLKLINNLIDITKIDTGYVKPILHNCNIVEEIKHIVLSVSSYAEAKGISLRFHSDTESFITGSDPEKLERILLNLLSNAVKFTGPDGSITVSVQCTQDKVSIAVSDTGIGIPPDKLESIFERFSQVDESLARSYEGSGIGLSLVRSLVNMFGGTISVHSELNKGSEFIIHLPARLVEEESPVGAHPGAQKNHSENINIEFSDIQL